jgi:hypothetical protein
MAAKHLQPICSAQQNPNRRAVGRPVDVRRPSALIPHEEKVERGSFPPFAAIFTNDRMAPPCGRSAALWVSDVTQKSVLHGN